MSLLDTVLLFTSVIILLFSIAVTPVSFQSPAFFLQLIAVALLLVVLLVRRA